MQNRSMVSLAIGLGHQSARSHPEETRLRRERGLILPAILPTILPSILATSTCICKLLKISKKNIYTPCHLMGV